MDDPKLMPLEGHLAELRRVLIVSLTAFLTSSIAIYLSCREMLFQYLTATMRQLELPLVFISVPEAFITKIKICIFFGIVLSLPVLFWQVSSFIFPAIKAGWRRTAVLLVISSYLLFLIGIVFAYQVVVRYALIFLLGSAIGLQPLVTVGRYVDFLFSLLLPFGFVFQLPLIVLGLTKVGIIGPDSLSAKRKYVYFIIFVAAAIMTPPDVISQMFLALPVIVLFEASLFIARFIVKPRHSFQEGGV